MTNDIDRSYHDSEHAPPRPHILPALPAPLSPREVYVGDKSMPLLIDRLTHSVFLRIASNAELGAALRLWVQAWSERPSGSVPNDHRWLADVTKLGDRWPSHAEVVLHGFVACNDGRLYHPVICKIAKKRFEQLKGRQRGAALSRRRQEAKRIEKRRKNAGRLAVSLATAAADDTPPF